MRQYIELTPKKQLFLIFFTIHASAMHAHALIADRNKRSVALSDLISNLIGRVVTVETITANEPPIEFKNDRRMRFDISCLAKTGELLNIEMSFDPGDFVPERFEFHEAKLFIGQDIHGKDKDSDLKEAWQITILSNDRFFPDRELIHTFRYYDDVNGVSLNGTLQASAATAA